jgi:hypothetical protein
MGPKPVGSESKALVSGVTGTWGGFGVELGFGVNTPTESKDRGASGMLIGAVEDCWVIGGRFEVVGFWKYGE